MGNHNLGSQGVFLDFRFGLRIAKAGFQWPWITDATKPAVEPCLPLNRRRQPGSVGIRRCTIFGVTKSSRLRRDKKPFKGSFRLGIQRSSNLLGPYILIVLIPCVLDPVFEQIRLSVMS